MFEEIFLKLGSEYDEVKNLLQTKKIDKAKSVLEEKGNNQDILILALLELVSNDNKKALKYLNQISDQKLDLIKEELFYEIIGTAYFQCGEIENSKYYLEKSLKFNNRNFYAKINLANIYLQQKKYNEAFNIYKDLIYMYPKDKTIIHNYNILKQKNDM